jgi:hypothetical protein
MLFYAFPLVVLRSSPLTTSGFNTLVNKIEENGCQPLKDCELALVLANVQLLALEPRQ